MRTETVTYNIYTYNELSEAAKQNVKDWYLNDYDRVYMFQDDVMENIEALFGKNHNMEVQFSLSYCQGDGLNIYGSVSADEIVNFLKNNKWFENPLNDEEMEIILFYGDDTNGIVLPNNRHSYFCTAEYIDFVDEWVDQLEYYAVKNIDIELIKKFNDVVVDIFKRLCKEYEEWGYEFFYEIEDAEMQDLCEANNWEFYENGTIY